MKKLLLLLSLVLSCNAPALAAPPSNFSEAKVVAKEKIYNDQANSALGELYCGCQWEWEGKSGGKLNPKACGYQPRNQNERAERTEWEHIVPAWTFGHQRQCWQKGGREFCEKDDPVFRVMEANLFNLYPAVGEVNGDRGNFSYGMVTSKKPQYGQCQTKVDFAQKVAEPRDEVKGLVARTTFYMFDRYNLNMSRQQQQLLMAWNKEHPVKPWEKLRDQRIAAIMGHSNPFVTGERVWTDGYKPVGDGVVSAIAAKPATVSEPAAATASTSGAIIASKNGNSYHLPEGCPSYSAIKEKNRVYFETEAQALAAGYKKAGNCK
ncbi:endonuclease [Pseudomonas sp. LJDD11]|uniref:endonuclease n=1 Tax=unclassified Pseudomonas TaxID=196821 RepID=UPI0004F64D9E|nr:MULTISPECIES: endonuclease [unclassified Pseudomonas]MCO8164977.1 endonuclease [Pseudomonas sp. 21LCFQ010]MCQ9422956.1 endonuclease [Pseudomonas sp. LJDD11]BAP45228.1 deoxyribonuclease I [Pseudomonas sp. StFLB209]